MISRSIASQMERSSWIRQMFEIGIWLRHERGAENVFDFSLGNPDVEPPDAVLETLRRLRLRPSPHSHGYMPNAGFPEVRASIARGLAARTGVPFTGDDIIMTNGAAGAINTVLKAILDPGDEVIVLSPYFPEYRFYIENHGGRMVTVETGADFQPDIPRIAAAITHRTKALILNSPNNPTGAVYGAEVLRELNGMICDPVLVISDEPYRPLVFDGLRPPEIASLVEPPGGDMVLVEGDGDSGERIGYLAIPPHLAEAGPAAQRLHLREPHSGVHQCPGGLATSGRRGPGRDGGRAPLREKRHLLCGASPKWARGAAATGLTITFSRKLRFPMTSPSSGSCRRKASWPFQASASDAAGTCACH